MQIHVGNPVEGEDFFDRKDELRKLWERLDANHILLLAPRRIGKTSLLRRLRETASANQYCVGLCSFAPCKNELECVAEIIRVVCETLARNEPLVQQLRTIANSVKGIKLGPGGIGIEFDWALQDTWQRKGETLQSILEKLEDRHIICVDEVPIFILTLLKKDKGDERAKRFLNWFRDLRQRHHKRIRWVLAGSIGLDTVVSRMQMGDTINDLYIFPLGAFDQKTAEEFLNELGDSYNIPLSLKMRRAIISRIGWPIPFYLQLFFDKLRDTIDTANLEVSQEIIEEVYLELLKPAFRGYFDYWAQRLKEELGPPDDAFAKRILDAACRAPEGVSREILSQSLGDSIPDSTKRAEMLRYLLGVLENDGYLVEVDGRFRFRFPWLRDYWLRYVAL